MDNFTAAILTLVVVSPAMVVLGVLIARGVRDAFETCPRAKAIERKDQLPGKLCGGTS